MAFSPDGRHLAFAAGKEASLWDTSTGELTSSWQLSAGLVDRLAFPHANHLFLYRVETETGEVGPFTAADPSKHPRVCRVRDLLGSEPLKPLAEIKDCNLHVYGAECSPDGKYYVVTGLSGSQGRTKLVANLYDGPAGKKLGGLPTEHINLGRGHG